MSYIPMTDAIASRRKVSPVSVDLFVVVLISGLVLLRMLWIVCASVDIIAVSVSDDAYYYFKTAQNIVGGLGSTFDGINSTNGFHPLWMCVILPIFATFSGHPDMSIRAVCALSTLLAGGSVLLSWGYVKALAGRSAGIIVLLLLLNPLMLRAFLNGLETGLLLFLLLLWLYLDQKTPFLLPVMSLSRRLLLGMVCGLLFLCRLDMLFVGGAVLGCIALSRLRLSTPRRSGMDIVKACAPALAGLMIIAGPYLFWNAYRFGHVMPISGAVKSTFPRICSDFMKFIHIKWLFGLTMVCVIIASMIVLQKRFRTAGRDQWGPSAERGIPILVVLCVACVLHFTYSALFMTNLVQWWHFATYSLVASIMVARVYGDLVASGGKKNAVANLVVCILICVGIGGTLTGYFWRAGNEKARYEAAVWASKHLPRDAVFAMTDCGMFGYFAQRRTVNLDGVINSYQYLDALSTGRLSEFLAKCHITHIVDYEVPVDRHYNYRIRLPARVPGEARYELRPSMSEALYVSAPYPQAGIWRWTKPHAQLIIWRYFRADVHWQTPASAEHISGYY